MFLKIPVYIYINTPNITNVRHISKENPLPIYLIPIEATRTGLMNPLYGIHNIKFNDIPVFAEIALRIRFFISFCEIREAIYKLLSIMLINKSLGM